MGSLANNNVRSDAGAKDETFCFRGRPSRLLGSARSRGASARGEQQLPIKRGKSDVEFTAPKVREDIPP
jgi:hypothetical protein